MNESQRQAYLTAMGIQPYYPRRPVAAAKASPSYEFDPATSVAPPAAAPVVAPRAPRSVDTPAAPRTPKFRAPEPASVPAPVAAAARQAPAPPEAAVSASDLRFRLNYYRVSDALAVIDEVPHQQARRDAGATLSLLHGILKALAIECGELTFDPELFHWPLVEGMSMKNDPAVEARKALQGFVAMRQQIDRFSNLIVFAGQVEDVLLTSADQLNRDYMVEGGGYHITVTHSLQAMLAHPVLKRDVWAHLQAVRKRLLDASGVDAA